MVLLNARDWNLRMTSKKQKISKQKYLPPEVWTQVLARLPLKTLLKFRCACKTWCSIIDDRHFFPMHLKYYTAKKYLLSVMETTVKRTRSDLCMFKLKRSRSDLCMFTLCSTDTLREVVKLFESPDIYNLLGSCNGLVLMSTDHAIILWNPSIRKYLVLPPCPLVSWRYVDYALGYASSSNDFKVVAFEVDESCVDSEVAVAVYTLSDNCWMVKDTSGMNIHKWAMYHEGEYVFFEGAVHWIAGDPSFFDDESYRFERTHLVSFDFDAEKMRYVELPDAREVVEVVRFIFQLGEYLAVFSISIVNSCIWVLGKDGGKESWSRWFFGDSGVDDFKFFHEKYLSSTVFYVEGSGTSLICGEYSYDIRRRKVKRLRKFMTSRFRLEPYVESLALCNGCKGRTSFFPLNC